MVGLEPNLINRSESRIGVGPKQLIAYPIERHSLLPGNWYNSGLYVYESLITYRATSGNDTLRWYTNSITTF